MEHDNLYAKNNSGCCGNNEIPSDELTPNTIHKIKALVILPEDKYVYAPISNANQNQDPLSNDRLTISESSTITLKNFLKSKLKSVFKTSILKTSSLLTQFEETTLNTISSNFSDIVNQNQFVSKKKKSKNRFPQLGMCFGQQKNREKGSSKPIINQTETFDETLDDITEDLVERANYELETINKPCEINNVQLEIFGDSNLARRPDVIINNKNGNCFKKKKNNECCRRKKSAKLSNMNENNYHKDIQLEACKYGDFCSLTFVDQNNAKLLSTQTSKNLDKIWRSLSSSHAKSRTKSADIQLPKNKPFNEIDTDSSASWKIISKKANMRNSIDRLSKKLHKSTFSENSRNILIEKNRVNEMYKSLTRYLHNPDSLRRRRVTADIMKHFPEIMALLELKIIKSKCETSNKSSSVNFIEKVTDPLMKPEIYNVDSFTTIANYSTFKEKSCQCPVVKYENKSTSTNWKHILKYTKDMVEYFANNPKSQSVFIKYFYCLCKEVNCSYHINHSVFVYFIQNLIQMRDAKFLNNVHLFIPPKTIINHLFKRTLSDSSKSDRSSFSNSKSVLYNQSTQINESNSDCCRCCRCCPIQMNCCVKRCNPCVTRINSPRCSKRPLSCCKPIKCCKPNPCCDPNNFVVCYENPCSKMAKRRGEEYIKKISTSDQSVSTSHDNLQSPIRAGDTCVERNIPPSRQSSASSIRPSCNITAPAYGAITTGMNLPNGPASTKAFSSSTTAPTTYPKSNSIEKPPCSVAKSGNKDSFKSNILTYYQSAKPEMTRISTGSQDIQFAMPNSRSNDLGSSVFQNSKSKSSECIGGLIPPITISKSCSIACSAATRLDDSYRSTADCDVNPSRSCSVTQSRNETSDMFVINELPTQYVANDQPTRSVTNDQSSRCVENDQPTRSVANDQPTRCVENDQPTRSVGNDQPTRYVAYDQPNRCVANDPSTRFVPTSVASHSDSLYSSEEVKPPCATKPPSDHIPHSMSTSHSGTSIVLNLPMDDDRVNHVPISTTKSVTECANKGETPVYDTSCTKTNRVTQEACNFQVEPQPSVCRTVSSHDNNSTCKSRQSCEVNSGCKSAPPESPSLGKTTDIPYTKLSCESEERACTVATECPTQFTPTPQCKSSYIYENTTCPATVFKPTVSRCPQVKTRQPFFPPKRNSKYICKAKPVSTFTSRFPQIMPLLPDRCYNKEKWTQGTVRSICADRYVTGCKMRRQTCLPVTSPQNCRVVYCQPKNLCLTMPPNCVSNIGRNFCNQEIEDEYPTSSCSESSSSSEKDLERYNYYKNKIYGKIQPSEVEYNNNCRHKCSRAVNKLPSSHNPRQSYAEPVYYHNNACKHYLNDSESHHCSKYYRKPNEGCYKEHCHKSHHHRESHCNIIPKRRSFDRYYGSSNKYIFEDKVKLDQSTYVNVDRNIMESQQINQSDYQYYLPNGVNSGVFNRAYETQPPFDANLNYSSTKRMNNQLYDNIYIPASTRESYAMTGNSNYRNSNISDGNHELIESQILPKYKSPIEPVHFEYAPEISTYFMDELRLENAVICERTIQSKFADINSKSDIKLTTPYISDTQRILQTYSDIRGKQKANTLSSKTSSKSSLKLKSAIKNPSVLIENGDCNVFTCDTTTDFDWKTYDKISFDMANEVSLKTKKRERSHSVDKHRTEYIVNKGKFKRTNSKPIQRKSVDCSSLSINVFGKSSDNLKEKPVKTTNKRSDSSEKSLHMSNRKSDSSVKSNCSTKKKGDSTEKSRSLSNKRCSSSEISLGSCKKKPLPPKRKTAQKIDGNLVKSDSIQLVKRQSVDKVSLDKHHDVKTNDILSKQASKVKNTTVYSYSKQKNRTSGKPSIPSRNLMVSASDHPLKYQTGFHVVDSVYERLSTLANISGLSSFDKSSRNKEQNCRPIHPPLNYGGEGHGTHKTRENNVNDNNAITEPLYTNSNTPANSTVVQMDFTADDNLSCASTKNVCRLQPNKNNLLHYNTQSANINSPLNFSSAASTNQTNYIPNPMNNFVNMNCPAGSNLYPNNISSFNNQQMSNMNSVRCCKLFCKPLCKPLCKAFCNYSNICNSSCPRMFCYSDQCLPMDPCERSLSSCFPQFCCPPTKPIIPRCIIPRKICDSYLQRCPVCDSLIPKELAQLNVPQIHVVERNIQDNERAYDMPENAVPMMVTAQQISHRKVPTDNESFYPPIQNGPIQSPNNDNPNVSTNGNNCYNNAANMIIHNSLAYAIQPKKAALPFCHPSLKKCSQAKCGMISRNYCKNLFSYFRQACFKNNDEFCSRQRRRFTHDNPDKMIKGRHCTKPKQCDPEPECPETVWHVEQSIQSPLSIRSKNASLLSYVSSRSCGGGSCTYGPSCDGGTRCGNPSATTKDTSILTTYLSPRGCEDSVCDLERESNIGNMSKETIPIMKTVGNVSIAKGTRNTSSSKNQKISEMNSGATEIETYYSDAQLFRISQDHIFHDFGLNLEREIFENLLNRLFLNPTDFLKSKSENSQFLKVPKRKKSLKPSNKETKYLERTGSEIVDKIFNDYKSKKHITHCNKASSTKFQKKNNLQQKVKFALPEKEDLKKADSFIWELCRNKIQHYNRNKTILENMEKITGVYENKNLDVCVVDIENSLKSKPNENTMEMSCLINKEDVNQIDFECCDNLTEACIHVCADNIISVAAYSIAMVRHRIDFLHAKSKYLQVLAQCDQKMLNANSRPINLDFNELENKAVRPINLDFNELENKAVIKDFLSALSRKYLCRIVKKSVGTNEPYDNNNTSSSHLTYIDYQILDRDIGKFINQSKTRIEILLPDYSSLTDKFQVPEKLKNIYLKYLHQNNSNKPKTESKIIPVNSVINKISKKGALSRMKLYRYKIIEKVPKESSNHNKISNENIPSNVKYVKTSKLDIVSQNFNNYINKTPTPYTNFYLPAIKSKSFGVIPPLGNFLNASRNRYLLDTDKNHKRTVSIDLPASQTIKSNDQIDNIQILKTKILSPIPIGISRNMKKPILFNIIRPRPKYKRPPERKILKTREKKIPADIKSFSPRQNSTGHGDVKSKFKSLSSQYYKCSDENSDNIADNYKSEDNKDTHEDQTENYSCKSYKKNRSKSLDNSKYSKISEDTISYLTLAQTKQTESIIDTVYSSVTMDSEVFASNFVESKSFIGDSSLKGNFSSNSFDIVKKCTSSTNENSHLNNDLLFTNMSNCNEFYPVCQLSTSTANQCCIPNTNLCQLNPCPVAQKICQPTTSCNSKTKGDECKKNSNHLKALKLSQLSESKQFDKSQLSNPKSLKNSGIQQVAIGIGLDPKKPELQETIRLRPRFKTPPKRSYLKNRQINFVSPENIENKLAKKNVSKLKLLQAKISFKPPDAFNLDTVERFVRNKESDEVNNFNNNCNIDCQSPEFLDPELENSDEETNKIFDYFKTLDRRIKSNFIGRNNCDSTVTVARNINNHDASREIMPSYHFIKTLPKSSIPFCHPQKACITNCKSPSTVPYMPKIINYPLMKSENIMEFVNPTIAKNASHCCNQTNDCKFSFKRYMELMKNSCECSTYNKTVRNSLLSASRCSVSCQTLCKCQLPPPNNNTPKCNSQCCKNKDGSSFCGNISKKGDSRCCKPKSKDIFSKPPLNIPTQIEATCNKPVYKISPPKESSPEILSNNESVKSASSFRQNPDGACNFTPKNKPTDVNPSDKVSSVQSAKSAISSGQNHDEACNFTLKDKPTDVNPSDKILSGQSAKSAISCGKNHDEACNFTLKDKPTDINPSDKISSGQSERSANLCGENPDGGCNFTPKANSVGVTCEMNQLGNIPTIKSSNLSQKTQSTETFNEVLGKDIKPSSQSQKVGLPESDHKSVDQNKHDNTHIVNSCEMAENDFPKSIATVASEICSVYGSMKNSDLEEPWELVKKHSPAQTVDTVINTDYQSTKKCNHLGKECESGKLTCSKAHSNDIISENEDADENQNRVTNSLEYSTTQDLKQCEQEPLGYPSKISIEKGVVLRNKSFYYDKTRQYPNKRNKHKRSLYKTTISGDSIVDWTNDISNMQLTTQIYDTGLDVLTDDFYDSLKSSFNKIIPRDQNKTSTNTTDKKVILESNHQQLISNLSYYNRCKKQRYDHFTCRDKAKSSVDSAISLDDVINTIFQ